MFSTEHQKGEHSWILEQALLSPKCGFLSASYRKFGTQNAFNQKKKRRIALIAWLIVGF